MPHRIWQKLADSISNGAFVHAAPAADWRNLELGKLKVTLTVNGTPVLEQVGGHATGDPLGIAVVLANMMREQGGVRRRAVRDLRHVHRPALSEAGRRLRRALRRTWQRGGHVRSLGAGGLHGSSPSLAGGVGGGGRAGEPPPPPNPPPARGGESFCCLFVPPLRALRLTRSPAHSPDRRRSRRARRASPPRSASRGSARGRRPPGAFAAMNPLMKSISVRRPLCMSCAIEGRCRSLRAAVVASRIAPSTSSSGRVALRRGRASPARCGDLRADSRARGRPAPPRRRAGCRRGGSRLLSRSLPPMPVAAVTPLRIPLTHSFDQRSPQRLVVACACRASSISASSSSAASCGRASRRRKTRRWVRGMVRRTCPGS